MIKDSVIIGTSKFEFVNGVGGHDLYSCGSCGCTVIKKEIKRHVEWHKYLKQLDQDLRLSDRLAQRAFRRT